MDDGSLFCSGCGSKVEINDTVKQAHTYAATEDNIQRQTENRSFAEPKKNASSGMKTIVIAALAAVVLAGGGFFAWQMLDSRKSDAAEKARLAAEQFQADEEARLAAEQAQAEEEARLAAEQAQAEEEARLAAEKVKAEAEKALADAKQQAQQARTAEAKAKAEAEQARLAEEARLAAAEARRLELEREVRRKELEARRSKAQSAAKTAATQKPAEPKTTQATLAAGTPVRVITSSEISTDTSKTGDGFTLILNEDISYGGRIVARRGATVRGVVSESDPGGRVKGVATISVTLTGITLADGSQAAIRTNEYNMDAPGSVGKNVAVTGASTGIGAAIGAIAGGAKGAGIGAGAGAATGVGVALATRGNPAVIAPETVIPFNLTDPLTVTLR